MIQTALYPEKAQWNQLMKRAVNDTTELKESVAGIIEKVRTQGDEALREFCLKFDGVNLNKLKVSTSEIDEADDIVSHQLKRALSVAAKNIAKFHKAQRMEEITVETTPGVMCTQRAIPISSVGLYVPGGNSPLFSTVLMLAIPARIAGCRKIVLCTPPNKEGKVHPAILYAARVAGVTEIYKVGGAQAIAAMAYGTETVPKVHKIFGPGNRFVMEAKQQVSTQAAAIDMPAGPSDVMIIADELANPRFVASDFLSQAEHGPDSQSILLTTSNDFAQKLPKVIDELLNTLPRKEMMLKSLAHSRIIVLKDNDKIMEFANNYAPEHLIINHTEADVLAQKVENAGSVFIGPYSPESAGDYASGTNHTLPTSGYAHAYSGVNLDSFCKKVTFQRLSKDGLQSIGQAIELMAENEDLMAHKLAVSVRLE